VKPQKKPLVGIVMGSSSDYETLQAAERVLQDFAVPYEIQVISAHRTPDLMFRYAKEAKARGLQCLIAGAGGAAHLPGMISALTPLPVLGVPVKSRALAGVDSLLSIVQMPAGIPTATFAIGEAGAVNAALFAVSLLALQNQEWSNELDAFREKKALQALEGNAVVQKNWKESEQSP
jgi:5-(carboxyamino)imidazole ribonucleotide mutase